MQNGKTASVYQCFTSETIQQIFKKFGNVDAARNKCGPHIFDMSSTLHGIESNYFSQGKCSHKT